MREWAANSLGREFDTTVVKILLHLYVSSNETFEPLPGLVLFNHSNWTYTPSTSSQLQILETALILPMKVEILAIQPVTHGLIHHLPACIVQSREIVQDRMADPMLSNAEILVSTRILLQQFVREIGNLFAVNCDDFVFIVESRKQSVIAEDGC